MITSKKEPDYRVAALRKSTQDNNGNIGVAWVDEKGRISVKLDSFVVLEGGPDLVLSLFPKDYHEKIP